MIVDCNTVKQTSETSRETVVPLFCFETRNRHLQQVFQNCCFAADLWLWPLFRPKRTSKSPKGLLYQPGLNLEPFFTWKKNSLFISHKRQGPPPSHCRFLQSLKIKNCAHCSLFSFRWEKFWFFFWLDEVQIKQGLTAWCRLISRRRGRFWLHFRLLSLACRFPAPS